MVPPFQSIEKEAGFSFVSPASPPASHAFASPSKLSAIELCPYCARQCEGWDSPRSEAAAHGAALHEAVYNDEAFGKLPDEDKALVRQIRAYCVNPYLEGHEILYEQRLDICDEQTGELLTFGTCDELIIREDKKTVLVNDFKFGAFPVPKADDNLQVYAYVVGVFQKYPECERVFAEIIQPSEGLSPENMASFSRKEDYPKLLAVVSNIVRRALEARPEDAVPSPEACKFCKKDTCKAYQEAMKAGLDMFCDSLTVETPDLPVPELVAWCDSKLQQVNLAEAYLKEIGTRLKQVILANNGSNAYKICPGRVTKTVNWKAICEKYNVSEEDIQANTTEKVSDPYVARKQPLKKGAKALLNNTTQQK